MTNSYQSTAFQPFADPSPFANEKYTPRVQPKSGIESLAETLVAINPNIQKFIGERIEDQKEKDKRKATKDRIQFELDKGSVAKASNKIRKTEGNDTARKVIGGSRAYRKQYEKVGVQLEALKLGNRLENDFDTFKVDTGKVDSNGQPITKFLREFESNSPEVLNWRSDKLNSAIQALEDRGVDPDAIDEFFIPTIQKQLFEIDDYATEQNQEFKYSQLQSEIPSLMDEVSQLVGKGKDEQAGIVLTEFLNNLYNAGITGDDANKTYTMIVKAAFDKSRLLVDPNDDLKLAIADTFADRILKAVPYGNSDLRSHSSYLDEAADFHEKYDKILLAKLQNPEKINNAKNKAKVKQGWQSINNMKRGENETIEDFNLKRKNKYNEILNNPEFSSKEVQDYAQSLGESDNTELINIEIPALKNKIRKGAFDGFDDILEQEIAILENNHATMDDEAIEAFEKLKTFAATSKGLAEDIDKSLRNIMTEIDRNLGTKDGFLTGGAPKDFAKSTRIRFEMQTQLTEYYQNFIETKERRPNSLERQNIERQYLLQMAAKENIGIDELNSIPGTGKDGRVSKADMINYLNNRTATTQAEAPKSETTTQAKEPVKEVKSEAPKAEAPKAAPTPIANTGDVEIVEMDRMRKLISAHMTMSKATSAHITSFVEADMTNIVNWRNSVKESFKAREGQNITFTPIIIEAMAKAVKDFPMINVSVDGTNIHIHKNVNIGMAAALPDGNLIVPVIKHCQDKNLVGITKSVNDLATRARAGKLDPDDIQDGTITMTNVGTFGNLMGTPIINQPQVAIMACGVIKKKPVVMETEYGDVIAVRHMMFLSLSYDHRVVDGALGGQFVRKVADYLEGFDTSTVV